MSASSRLYLSAAFTPYSVLSRGALPTHTSDETVTEGERGRVCAVACAWRAACQCSVCCVCVSALSQRPHSHTHASFACGPEIYHYQSRVFFITPRARTPWFSVRVTERVTALFVLRVSVCGVGCGGVYNIARILSIICAAHYSVVRVAKISRTHPQTHRPYTTYIKVNKGERAAL